MDLWPHQWLANQQLHQWFIWGRAICHVVRPYCIWVTDRMKGDWCRGQSLKKKERKREFLKLLLSGRWCPEGNGGRKYRCVVKNTFFDAKTEPCFVTKSVRLNRTELSIGGFWRIFRDLAPRKGPRVSFKKNKEKIKLFVPFLGPFFIK